jgi:hypothetical protein
VKSQEYLGRAQTRTDFRPRKQRASGPGRNPFGLPSAHVHGMALRLQNPEAFARTLSLLKATAPDTSLFGTAGHLLYIGTTAPTRCSRTSSRS